MEYAPIPGAFGAHQPPPRYTQHQVPASTQSTFERFKHAIPGADTFNWHDKTVHVGKELAMDGVPHSVAGVVNLALPEDATESFFSGSTSWLNIFEGLLVLFAVGFMIAMLVDPTSVGYKAGFGIFLTLALLMGANLAIRHWFMADNRWLNFL